MNQFELKEHRARELAAEFAQGNRDKVALREKLGCSQRTLYYLLENRTFRQQLKRHGYKGPIAFVDKRGRKRLT